MGDDINQRCTAALRALEAAGVIASAWLPGLDSLMSGRYRDSHVLSPQWWTENEVINLSDPVTAASLIVLVREAWDDETCHTVPLIGASGGASRIQWMCWISGGRYMQRDTEAEAIVAALEAKAQEVTQ